MHFTMVWWCGKILDSEINKATLMTIIPLIIWTTKFRMYYMIDGICMYIQGQTTRLLTHCTWRHIQYSYIFQYGIPCPHAYRTDILPHGLSNPYTPPPPPPPPSVSRLLFTSPCNDPIISKQWENLQLSCLLDIKPLFYCHAKVTFSLSPVVALFVRIASEVKPCGALPFHTQN